MAFEDDLGLDPSQARAESYTLSATGLVSRTFNLWTRKLIQYIIIVGLTSTVLALVSFIVLATIFASIGTIEVNPISYILNLFSFSTLPGITLIAVSLAFATIGFIIDAVLAGAATKFALDDYAGGQVADIGASFSTATGKTLNIIIIRIITTVLVTGVLTPAFILMAQALAGIDITDPFNPIISPGALEAMMAAMVFLIVGGIFAIYIAIRFAPVIAIVVDTDLSAIRALKKSWDLTGGNVLHTFGGIFLMGLIVAVIGMVISFAVFLNPYSLVIQAIISALFLSALNLVFNVVLYKDLSSRKGDSGLESLAIGEY